MGKSIENMISEAIKSLREVADANTVVGQPINIADGTVIVPISTVKIGIGLGGGDNSSKNSVNAGTGAGVSVSPVAFITIKDGDIKIMQLNDNANTANKVIDMVPAMFDKVTDFVSNGKDEKKDK
ncbi:MAG: GerW family sporulation protein [Oscillospiraceae bacterium]